MATVATLSRLSILEFVTDYDLCLGSLVKYFDSIS